MGVVARVNVDLAHAEGEPIQVYWEIIDESDGTVEALSKEWSQMFAAYQLTATTDPDRGFFKLWVPLPERRGSYRISLIAGTGESQLPLDEEEAETVVH